MSEMPNHVILAEDDTALRDTLGGRLERDGLVILPAKHAGEAMDLFEKDTEAGNVGALVTDLQMNGHEWDGARLIAEFQRRRPYIYTVLMSGRPPEDVRQALDRWGVTPDHCVKKGGDSVLDLIRNDLQFDRAARHKASY